VRRRGGRTVCVRIDALGRPVRPPRYTPETRTARLDGNAWLRHSGLSAGSCAQRRRAAILPDMRYLDQTLLLVVAWTLTGCEKPAPPEAPAPAEAAPEVEAPSVSPAPPSSVEQPAGPPSAKRAPCDTDQSCNDDPAVSALWGRCVGSVCQCQPGFELMPWGRCKPVK
jgi:hypothetical protein